MAKLQKLLWAAEQPDRDSRRQPLVARRRAPRRALRRALRAAGRDHASAALHLFDALHPCYAGDLGIGPNPKLVARIKAADLVRAGRRPARRNAVAGLHAVRHSRARRRRSCTSIPAPRSSAASTSPHLADQRRADGVRRRARRPAAAERDPLARRDQGRACRLSRLDASSRPTQPGAVNLGEIMVWLREHLPADAIITNGAGNYATWIHRFYRFRRFAHADRADLGLDGLRRAGGGRR